MTSRRGFLKAMFGLFFASLSSSVYAIGIEPMRRLTVQTYRFVPPNWPRDLHLRLVLVADIHACDPFMPAKRIGEICERANGLGGDMVLLLGDFLSGMGFGARQVPPQDWARELSVLQAPLGIHAIMGNHDWLDDPQAMATGQGPTVSHHALASIGVPVYDNRAQRFEKNGQPFWLAGLADQVGPDRPLHDLPATLAQVTDDAPVILMAHEPDIFPDVPDRVAVTLSGHTHGGQIRLFGYSPFVPSRFGTRFIYGHIVEQGRNLVVSGGLGTSMIPVRFGSPPEIVVLELG